MRHSCCDCSRALRRRCRPLSSSPRHARLRRSRQHQRQRRLDALVHRTRRQAIGQGEAGQGEPAHRPHEGGCGALQLDTSKEHMERMGFGPQRMACALHSQRHSSLATPYDPYLHARRMASCSCIGTSNAYSAMAARSTALRPSPSPAAEPAPLLPPLQPLLLLHRMSCASSRGPATTSRL